MNEGNADIDDGALTFLGRSVSVSTFNLCVARALRNTENFSPRRTAGQTGLDDRFLRHVQKGTKGVSLFTLFKIASATGKTASQIAAIVEDELRSEVEK